MARDLILRMPSLNSVTITGYVGRDTDVKYAANGTPVMKLPVAHNKNIKRGDQWEQKTIWFDVDVFGKLAERLAGQMTKGRPVIIEGVLDVDEWNEQGTNKKRTKVKITARTCRPLDRDASAGGRDRYGAGRDEPRRDEPRRDEPRRDDRRREPDPPPDEYEDDLY